MHPFKAFMSLYSKVADDDWAKISSSLEYKIFQQNRIILKEGNICQNLYFLENGSIRFFTPSEFGNNTIQIIAPPSLFTSAKSFSHQMPSEFGIQALEESYVWVLDRKNANELLELESWNRFLKSYFNR